MQDLYDISKATLEDWLIIGKDGSVTINPNRPARARKALKRFKFQKVYDKQGNECVNVDIELHDQIKCKELVGKHLGMFVDKVEVKDISNKEINAAAMFDSMTIEEKKQWLLEQKNNEGQG